ncbi:uncharacterized protein LOC135477933 [Liolophura sinensis]|uniref:uncharacterized protein LOC135477933 n=1 Tax=Liolophura sinensis TaxID=3198878 RepID=UPI003158EF92
MEKSLLLSTVNTRRKTRELGIVLPKLFEDEPRGSSEKKRSKLREEAENTCDEQDCNDSEYDLFSTYSSMTGSQNFLKDTEVRQQMEDETWVQCDSIHCQKWRRVLNHEINDIAANSKWFCFMNSDPAHNTCEASEEDYASYDKLARKIGLKYVFSELEEGALVWATVVGYCRWPALVTKDPSCGVSMDVDQEEDPLFYHVEFLGEPRSHGWVRSHFVTVYGHKNPEGPKEPDSSSTSTSKSECRSGLQAKSLNKRRGKRITNQTQKPKLKVYRRQSVDVAIKEAETMLGWSEEERLKTCVFKWLRDETQEHSRAEPNSAFDFTDEDENTVLRHKSKGRGKKRKKSRQGDVKEKSKHLPAKSEAPLKRNFEIMCNGEGDKCQHRAGKKEISFTTSNGQIRHKTSSYRTNFGFKSSLVNTTKEERLAFDVEMYRRNEKAFEHDVRRFMDRHSMKIGASPVWQNTPVTLFQLFITVFELGGFHYVCKQKGWARVYREVTNSPSSTSGSVAKSFYLRNLLPYEFYIRGREYDESMMPDVIRANKSLASSQRQSDEEKEDTEAKSEGSEDLEAMLATLEESSSLLRFDDEVQEASIDLQPPAEAPAGTRGLDILFYDDSPETMLSPGIKLADTASEFGLPNLPGDTPPSPQDADSHPMSGADSEEDSAEELLQELQNVQQQINLLQDQFGIEE